MTHQEAIKLIEEGNITPSSTWADLGAGGGRFSYALADLIGTKGIVYAIDQQNINLPQRSDAAQIISLRKDFTRGIELEGLDGILMANALHYVEDQQAFLSKMLKSVKKGGGFILIEYDTEIGNPWIPCPISFKKFRDLVKKVGLSESIEIGRQQSRYGNGEIYSATCQIVD